MFHPRDTLPETEIKIGLIQIVAILEKHGVREW